MNNRNLSWTRLLVIGLFLTVIFAIITTATHNMLTQPFPGHNDFLSRWEGARSFWIDGLNPYGEQASINIQTFMYGRPALPDEDQVLFAYPMYTAILIAPLVFVEYALASAFIMVFMGFMLLVGLFALLDLFNLRPTIGQLFLLCLIAILHYTTSRGLILGQLGTLCAVMYMLTFWGLHREHDRLAGIALTIATIKPQLGFLIVPFLLLWGLRAKRYQFVSSFVMSFAVLVGLSFLLVPTWLVDMWAQVAAYSGYAPPIPTDVLFVEVLGLPANTKYVVFLFFWVGLLVTWYQVLIQGKLDRAMWVAMLTLAVSNLASPVIATPHFAVFLIPLVFYVRELSRKRKQQKWTLLLMLFILIEPWIRFFITLDYETTLESFWMAFPEPIVVLVALWFTRKLWWTNGNVLRPAETVKA